MEPGSDSGAPDVNIKIPMHPNSPETQRMESGTDGEALVEKPAVKIRTPI